MNSRNIILIIVLALIVLVGGCAGCSAISLQRTGVRLEENIKGKWGNVQSEYQRRADLIPNLVNTVKGEANFEQTTLQNVINARARATSIQVNPDDLTNPPATPHANNRMDGFVQRKLKEFVGSVFRAGILN